jgi:hypothetical protein
MDLVKEVLKHSKENELNSIETSFDYFRKDLKRLSKDKVWINDKENGFNYNLLKDNLNGTIIFLSPFSENEFQLKKVTLPFSKFFVGSNIIVPIGNEVYQTQGFFVLDLNEKEFVVFYIWSRTINDGWGLHWVKYNKEMFNKDSKEFNDYLQQNPERKDNLDDFYQNKIYTIFVEKFFILFKSLLNKIEKKEYTSYKKWTPLGYETKEIVYSHDVCSHRRHFWEDSGRFKIPLMSEEELKQKGYGIDEVVFRDGELRKDVPYKLIDSFVVGGDKPKKEENRVIELFKRKILRQEDKIYNILKEIYPDKIIRRHDRKTLKGLELDFNIPELRLGIEYDGEQHFDKELYLKLYGVGFDEQVKRDRAKENLCRKRSIKLIRIKFDEPLTKKYLINKINKG